MSQQEQKNDLCNFCQCSPSLLYRPDEIISYSQERFVSDSEYYTWQIGSDWQDQHHFSQEEFNFPLDTILRSSFMICCNELEVDCNCVESECISFSNAIEFINFKLQEEYSWEEFCYEDLSNEFGSCFDCKYFESSECFDTVAFVKKAYELIEVEDDLSQVLDIIEKIPSVSKCSGFEPYDDAFSEDYKDFEIIELD